MDPKELANRIGVRQAWIAQIENPNYSGFRSKTLLKLTSVFDIGLIVRYVPISNLVEWELGLSSESLKVQSFEEVKSIFKPHATNTIFKGGLVLGGQGIFDFINPSLRLPQRI